MSITCTLVFTPGSTKLNSNITLTQNRKPSLYISKMLWSSVCPNEKHTRICHLAKEFYQIATKHPKLCTLQFTK